MEAVLRCLLVHKVPHQSRWNVESPGSLFGALVFCYNLSSRLPDNLDTWTASVLPSEHAHPRRGLADLDLSISCPSAPRRLPVPETVLLSLLHRTQAPQYILAHAAAAALGLSS